MKSFLIVLVSLLISLNSCSTIQNGRYDILEIESVPNNAIIFVNDVEIGPTPAILELKRGASFEVEIRKDGYIPYTIKIRKKYDGWFWGNMFFFGAFGLMIDLANGNAYKVEPNYVKVILNKKQQ